MFSRARVLDGNLEITKVQKTERYPAASVDSGGVAMDGHVVAAPMNELAVRNAKYAGECTELHLGKRNISVLADLNRCYK